MMNRIFLFASAMLFAANLLIGQHSTRSGLAGGLSAAKAGTETFPCQGTAVLDEDFENGMPAGWTVVDGDGRTPQAATGLAPGWQGAADLIDTLDHAALSTSWYSPKGQSDDWLITPQVTLGSNPCLSWEAYSRDPFFPEAYEIRISTATADTADFLANPAVFTIDEEGGDPVYRSINLAQYGGQQVYIAFRQTSDDKFILVLDDIRLTNVAQRDAGVWALDTLDVPALASAQIRGEIFNFGSDTLQSVDVHWSVDGGTANDMSLDSLDFCPNTKLTFFHDVLWTPDTTRTFNLCVWTSNPNGGADGNLNNDTLCLAVVVDEFVGRAPDQDAYAGLKIGPVPAREQLRVFLAEAMLSRDPAFEIVSVLGQNMMAGRLHETVTDISIHGLSGMYWLRILEDGKPVAIRKFIVE